MSDSRLANDIEFFEKKYGNTPVEVFSRIRIPYKWHVGKIASTYFQKLKNEKAVYGLRCEPCGKTIVPPRESCPFCYGKLERWVKLNNEAVIESFTVREDKVALLVRFKQADTSILHKVLDTQSVANAIKIGTEVEAVFSSEGISGFKLKGSSK